MQKLAPLLVLAAAVAALLAVPFSAPMNGFWRDAQQFATVGHISSVFTPCGYPALLGLGLRLGGMTGVLAIQLLIYLFLVVSVYLILRLLEVKKEAATLGACLLGFHPDLLLNIKKIWDTNVTAALLLALLAALLWIMRRGLTHARAIVAGSLWGLSINVRPNFPVLALPIVFALCVAPIHENENRLKALATKGTLVLAAATIVVIAVSTAVHGSFYFPQNGPYNFYAGDNSFTARALITNLNAEPSIYPSLLAAGFSPEVDIYSPDLRPYYAQQGLLFIRRNTLRAVGLVMLKLGTLLRPDTKIHPMATAYGMAKVFLALPIPLWLLTLVLFRKYPWGPEDWLFVAYVVAYILPFLLTNADPRFRIPLDILVLTHSIDRVARFSRWCNPPLMPAA